MKKSIRSFSFAALLLTFALPVMAGGGGSADTFSISQALEGLPLQVRADESISFDYVIRVNAISSYSAEGADMPATCTSDQLAAQLGLHLSFESSSVDCSLKNTLGYTRIVPVKLRASINANNYRMFTVRGLSGGIDVLQVPLSQKDDLIPKSLVFSNSRKTGAVVSWSPVAGASAYRVRIIYSHQDVVSSFNLYRTISSASFKLSDFGITYSTASGYSMSVSAILPDGTESYDAKLVLNPKTKGR